METTPGLASGSRLGNYILEEPIGRGAFAEVWKAHHHERPQRVVAVKIATEPRFRKQLQREARLPEFDHPNIVPILDSDTRFAKSPYIVMPYLTGGNLTDLIRAHPNGLPELRIEMLLAKILSGLAEAHRRGIVHRDIKPSNILLDGNGGVLIADFGLSANDATTDAARSMQQSTSLAAQGVPSIAGSYAYMAPEVLDGTPPTPAADVYSVGIVLFEMLTGRRAHGVELPSLARPSLSNAAYWDALFYWSCCRRPERYADALALKAAADGSPAPTPFASQPDEADSLPSVTVAPLPSDRWEGVAARWQERKNASSAIEDAKAEHKSALEIYAENHAHVRALALKVLGAEKAYRDADQRLRELCAKIASELSEQLEGLTRQRARLIREGLLPAHPEIQTIDRQLSPPSLAIARTLPDLDRSAPDVQALEAWLQTLREGTVEAYDAFWEKFGTDPQNPWVELSLKRFNRRGNRIALIAGGILVVLLILVGCAAFIAG